MSRSNLNGHSSGNYRRKSKERRIDMKKLFELDYFLMEELEPEYPNFPVQYENSASIDVLNGWQPKQITPAVTT